MRETFLRLIVLSLGVVLFALFVDSKGNVNRGSQPAPPRGPPSSPPPLSPPPPPPYRSSPRPPSQSSAVPPPPPRSPPPPPSRPPSPTPSTQSQLPPPPPRKDSVHSNPGHPPNGTARSSPQWDHKHGSRRENVAAARQKQKLNLGKTIGLLFVGIAATLQVCVGTFLVFKRRQLLKAHVNF